MALNKNQLANDIVAALRQLKTGKTEHYVGSLLADAIDDYVKSADVDVDLEDGSGSLS